MKIILVKDPSLVDIIQECAGKQWVVLSSNQCTNTIEFYQIPEGDIEKLANYLSK
jgi:hypothetical protein